MLCAEEAVVRRGAQARMAGRRAVTVREVGDAEQGAAAQQRLQRGGVELRVGGEAERA